MHPLVAGGLLVAIIALLGAGAEMSARRVTPRASAASLDGTRTGEAPAALDAPGLSAVCADGFLPDGDGCVPLPTDDGDVGEELLASAMGHHDKRGTWQVYDQIPRRPDRPEDYTQYGYPVAPPPSGPWVLSGYDLDRPDEAQRRARRLSHVGHGGIDLAQARGAEVRVIRLDHQEGDAQVLYAGKLFGTTVLTRHTVREGGRLRDYVLLHGHLDGTARGVTRGLALKDGDPLGFVGDSGSPGVVHLHLEVRQVRDGVDVMSLPAPRIMANEISVVCDPRNVLPMAR